MIVERVLKIQCGGVVSTYDLPEQSSVHLEPIIIKVEIEDTRLNHIVARNFVMITTEYDSIKCNV